MATMTVTTTPAKVPDGWILVQNNGAVRVYFEDDSSVTTSNGCFLEPGGSYERGGSLWVCTASGTADLRYLLFGV